MMLNHSSKIASRFRLAIGILSGLIATALWGNRQHQELSHRAAQTHQIMNEMDRLGRSQAEMEAQARDYLLTGNAASHAEYLAALKRADTDWDYLNRVSQGETSMQPYLAELQTDMEKRHERLASAIARYETGDNRAAEHILLSRENVHSMHQFSATLTGAMRKEKRLLRERQEEEHALAGQTGLAMLALTGLLYGSLMAAYVTLRRDTHTLVGETVRLKEEAETDGLTGLKNHRAFEEKLAEEFRRSQQDKTPLSVMLMDVDWFKLFNDTFGHPCGDAVLQRVATLLEIGVRQTDFVARYGGEEFVVVLPRTDEAEAQRIAERVRALIETEAWLLRPVTVSIGTACIHKTTATPGVLVKQADQALYLAKSLGRNRCSHHYGLALAS